MKKPLIILLILTLFFALASCKEAPTGLWEKASFTEDAYVGEGENSFTFKVTAEQKTVTLTVSTSKNTVGEALEELNLLAGEEGQYGLYVQKVNGIELVYETHGMYWAFYVDGAYATAGVDTTEIESGKIYEFKAEK